MNNKDLFINGFLERIGKEYPQDPNPKTNLNLAFEIFGIASVLDKPFQEVFDKIIIKNKNSKRSGSMDGGIDGIWFNDLGDYYEMYVFQCKNAPGLKDNELHYCPTKIGINSSTTLYSKGLHQKNTMFLFQG